jgi:hypothetical protein
MDEVASQAKAQQWPKELVIGNKRFASVAACLKYNREPHLSMHHIECTFLMQTL